NGVVERAAAREQRPTERYTGQALAQALPFAAEDAEVRGPLQVGGEDVAALAEEEPRGEAHQVRGAIREQDLQAGREPGEGAEGAAEPVQAAPVSEPRVALCEPLRAGIVASHEEALEQGGTPFGRQQFEEVVASPA